MYERQAIAARANAVSREPTVPTFRMPLMSQPVKAIVATTVNPAVAQSLTLSALQQRRELLSQQYQEAMTQRGQIAQERLNAEARGDVGMVRDYEAAVARIGTLMRELEKTRHDVDQQIMAAVREPIDVSAMERPITGDAIATSVEPAFPLEFARLLESQRAVTKRVMVGGAASLLLLAAVLWRVGIARGRRSALRELAGRTTASRDNERMQQSIDAIAIEVERMSEGQRYVNQLLTSRRSERDALPAAPPNERSATPRDGHRNTPH